MQEYEAASVLQPVKLDQQNTARLQHLQSLQIATDKNSMIDNI
jgi:hypothetical protein